MEMSTLPADFSRMRRARADTGSPVEVDHSLGDKDFGDACNEDADDDEVRCCGRRGGFRTISHELGLHGVRRMASGQGGAMSARRVIWGAILVLALAFVVFQAMNCVERFLTAPTSTSIVLQPRNPVPLPAVTLCPSHPLRLTEVHKKGWLKFMYEFSRPVHEEQSVSKLNKINVTSRKVYEIGGHRSADVVVSCHSDQGPCSEAAFSTTLTEHGTCFTHNMTGRKLRLVLNPATYDQFDPSGSGEPCGFRALFHSNDEFPSEMHGPLLLPTGYHSSVQLTGQRVRLLAPPEGSCSSAFSSASDCIASCHASNIEASCGCTPFWVSTGDNSNICSMRRHLTCAHRPRGSFSDYVCHCPTPCSSYKYQGALSLAKLTDDTFERLAPKYGFPAEEMQVKSAEDIRVRFSSETQKKDVRNLDRLQESLMSVTVDFEQLTVNMSTAESVVQNEMLYDIRPRLKFHIHTALGGLKRTLEHGFIAPWNEIEDKFLSPLATGFHEIISAFEGSTKQLSFISMNEDVTRKVFYYIMDGQLSGKLEIAIKALSNITSIYESLTEYKPIAPYVITPDKHYDEALIPEETLEHFRVQVRELHNELTTSVANLMEDILAMKKVLKDVYTSRSKQNTTAKEEAAAKFLEHSKQIGTYTNLFRTKIIDKARESIDSQIDRVKKINHTIVSSSNALMREIQVKKHIIMRYRPLYNDALFLAKIAGDYSTGNSRVTMSRVVDTWLDNSNVEVLNELKNIYDTLASESKSFTDLWRKLQNSIDDAWRAIVLDISTRKFYFQVNNDFTTYDKHHAKYLKDIFTHPRLLGLDGERARTIRNDELRTLLNADVSTMDLNQKLEENHNLCEFWRKKTDIVYQYSDNMERFNDVHSVVKTRLENFRSKTTLDKQFVRENFIELHITIPESNTSELVETAGYSLTDLLKDTGIAVMLFLGASVLTFVELIDVLLSCICRRDRKKKKKKKHTRSPDKHSSMRGTPVIQYETISQQPPKDIIYHSHPISSHNHVHSKPHNTQTYVPTRTIDSGNGNGTMTSLSSRKYKEIPPPRVHFANTDI